MANRGDLVLVTGFSPFGGDDENPSRLVARALSHSRIEGLTVVSAELPVSAAGLGDALEPLWRREPVAILHLGLAGHRAQLALERIAVNLYDFRIPDNAGERLHDMPIAADGPAAYWSTLDVSGTVSSLRHHGIPAYASLTAGAFLCNAAMYLSLHHLARSGREDVPCGFLHLPYLPAQAATKASDVPSLPLDIMVDAARLVLEAAVLRRRARLPRAWAEDAVSAGQD
jgi:pyroglutamyl-peptidase